MTKDEQIKLLRDSLREMCDMVAPTVRSESRLSQGLSSALIRARMLLKRVETPSHASAESTGT